MTFDRLEVKNRSTQVAEVILQALRDGRYKPGDRLPSEREMAHQLGVSRPSVREAVAALQMVGVLRSRAGDGTYVGQASPLANQSRISELLRTGSSPSEVLDARQILETSAAMFAAERATPSDVAELKNAFQQLEEAIEATNFEAVVQANMLLHAAVVKATHNPIVAEVLTPLVSLMGDTLSKYMRQQLLTHERGDKELLAVHRKMVDAISTKKPTAAWKAMREHFQSVAQGLGFLDEE